MNTPNRTQWIGFFRALVIDDRDPLFKGRVKVRIPDLMVADEQRVGRWDSNGLWASPGNNFLGGRSIQDTQKRHQGPDAFYQGSCLIPPKGSHVWVWFEKDDISHPFYGSAAEYGDCQTLPENQLGNQYQKKWTLFKSAEGRAIVFSDDNDDARIEVTGKKRKIKNPPFGDIESVYKVDDNQTVFLVDERRNHEKILLKDYRGNFIKLTQDEGGENDQLHIHMKNDIHIETMRNFYLTVAGDMHVKVIGSYYLTALQKINVKAIEDLKETARSFDRYSDIYDNTTSSMVNIKASAGNINMMAALDIFQESIRNIRNSTVTSDTSAGITTINAGGAIGLCAGGMVSIYGYYGTAIQSAPLTFPESGQTEDATSAQMATNANPIGKRNEIIRLTTDAPILTTPIGLDSRGRYDFDHEAVNVSQPASSKVGQEDPVTKNVSQSKSSPSKSCCGGGGNKSEKPSKTTDKSKEKEKDNQSIGDCCGKASDKSLLELSDFDKVLDRVLEYLTEIKDKVSDEVFSQITGAVFDMSGLWEDYDIEDMINELVTQYSVSDSIQDAINNVGNNIEDSIKDIVDVADFDFTNAGNDVSSKFESDYQEVTSDGFISNLLSVATSMLGSITGDIIPSISDTATSILQNVINNPKNATELFSNGIYDFVGNIADSLVSNGFSEYKDTFYHYLNNITDLPLTDIDKAIHDTLNLDSYEAAKSINNQNQKIIDGIESNVNLSLDSTNIINNKDIDVNVKDVATQITKFIDQCKNIEAIKDDPSIIDTAFNELVNSAKSIMSTNVLSNDDKSKIESKLNTDVIDSVKSNLRNVLSTANQNDIINYIPDISKVIKNELDGVSFSLMGSFSDMTSELSKVVTDSVISNLISPSSITGNNTRSNSNINTQYNEIIEIIKRDPTDISLKNKVDNLIQSISDKIKTSGYIASVVDSNKLLAKVNTFIEIIRGKYPSQLNNVLYDKLHTYSIDVTNSVNKTRRDNLDSIFTKVAVNNNQFSNHDSSSYVIPNHCGCGYNYLLFLKDKYRKTIVPLISNSGGDVLAFSVIIGNMDSLIKSTSKKWIEETQTFEDDQITDSDEEVEFLDSNCAKSYINLLNQIKSDDSIDTTTKWWQNLKDILNTCSIANIKVVMTIFDFRDGKNIFLNNSQNDYTDENWSDDKQGKFLTALFDVCKETSCDIIYNLGYGSYKHPFDEKNEKYQIYPNCGYLRRYILWCVYQCGISSNNLSLTGNANSNLYYYNPYCEWKSYDDCAFHNLMSSELTTMDCVDGYVNDNAEIVEYDYTYTIIGGYANYLVSSDVHSLPIFNMQNLKEKISETDNVKDPNIMSKIFCSNSRAAIRHFKYKDLEHWKEFEFDEDGEVTS